MTQAPVPVLIGGGLTFAEGVNFGPDGTLYCVDVLGGAVWRMRRGEALREWVHTGGPNGSRFGPEADQLYVADCQRKAILRIATSSGAVAVVVDNHDGAPFNGPNDLCFGPDGTLYFTDPLGSSLSHPIGGIYARAPGGAVTQVAGGLGFPNGAAVTPDGATLIVADTHPGLLRRYSLAPGQGYRELAPLAALTPAGEPDAHGEHEAGPDGMAFGADGNLYVAHYGTGRVRVIAPAGDVVRDLPTGGPTPTNVAFWDDSLYVTEGAGGAVYRLEIGVREQRPFMRPW